MSTPSRPLTRRPSRTVPLTVMAVTAVAFGGLGTWLLGAYAISGAWPAGTAPRIDDWSALPFESLAWQVTAAVLAVLGLILVLCALLPGDAARRTILEDGTPGQTAVSRRDLARRVQRSVEHVDGVQGARVTLRRSRLQVEVRTPVEDTETVTRRTRQAMEDAVASLEPARPLRPRIRLVRTR